MIRGRAIVFVCLLLGACASPSSVAVDEGAERVLYYTSVDARTTRSEPEYVTSDGTALGYVAHLRAEPSQTALVYLHGIESHAGWFDAAADGLCAAGYDVFCLDRRGSGINRENRGLTSGHVRSAELLVQDIHDFVVPLRERYDSVVLLGLSWGGKLATVYGLTHPDQVDGLILITPGLVAEVDVGWYEKLGIFCCTFLSPRTQYATPIEPEMFTTTPRYLEDLRRDPLKLEYASARFFWESRGLDGFVEKRIEENQLPILLYLAENDRIIDNGAVRALLERGGTESLEVLVYEDQTHSIQFDASERLVQDALDWLERLGTAPRP